MRKLFVALIALAFVVSCASPVSTVEKKTIVAVNSLWQVVKKETVARSADAVPLVDFVANYNAVTMDDFLRLYEEGQIPDIRDSPPVSVFIVNPLTYAVNWSAENIPRISLVENADAWRYDSHGQLLFIDHIPPKPVYPWESTPYEWYAQYVVEGSGKIVYEDHAGYYPDESFHGQWILLPLGETAPDGTPGGGWISVDAYYYTINQAYRSEMWRYPDGRLIEHQLYTEPSYVN